MKRIALNGGVVNEVNAMVFSVLHDQLDTMVNGIICDLPSQVVPHQEMER